VRPSARDFLAMSKKIKIIIPVVIILLVLIAVGIFYWWQWKRELPQEKIIQKRIPVDSAEYEIKDTPEGKIVENKKEGLTVKAPAGWIVEKYGEEVDLLSPETEFDQYGGVSLKSVREKGACGMAIQILKYEKVDPEITTYAEDLRTLIEEAQNNPVKEETAKSEVVMISKKLGFKRTSLKEDKETYISVEIPVNHTVYGFYSGLIFSEKCVQEFNKILETVSINK